MKKILLILVAFLVFCMGTTALAQEPQTVQNPDGSYTTSGSDIAFADAQMTLLVIKGTTITIDSIQYIDQVGADSAGVYSFSNYYPKDEPTEQSGKYTVRLGGQTLDEPVIAGFIGMDAGFTFSGVISSVGTRKNAQVTLTDKANASNVYSVLANIANGTFEIENVLEGEYVVEVTKLSHLDYKKNKLELTGDSADNNYMLYAGDVIKDSNNSVNIFDIAAIVSVFNQSVDETSAADINGDGIIDIYDISYAITNFNRTATVED